MNKIIIIVFIISIAIHSCKTELNDLSGGYESIADKQIVQIKRIDDKAYEVILPYDTTKFIFKRKADTLFSTFQRTILTCEFNYTYDTLFAKENGELVITFKKITH